MDTVCVFHRRNQGHNLSNLGFMLVILFGVQASTAYGQQLCQSSKPPYSTIFVENIPENFPVNSILSNLDIIGSDSEISLRLYKNDYVSLDTQSRNLTLKKKLNREDMDSINFRIECSILSRSQSIDINGRVLILDINNNPPVFEKPEYMANISEMAPIGTTVVSGMVATDADIDNWYITYEIVDGPYSAFFNIPISSKGDIVLKKQLDYELTHQMQVTIMAKDNHYEIAGMPQIHLNSTITLVINIYDGDDQNPSFLYAPYLAMVEENSPIGTILDVQPKIYAFDQDFGINATVQYSLVPDTINSEDEYFTINPQSSRLELKKDALRRGTKFCLLIKATETSNPDRYATTSVRVWVQAANESPPRFVDKLYTASLVENAPVGSLVTVVSALDNDEVASESIPEKASNGVPTSEGALLLYSFDSNLVTDFTIDHRTGHVKTAKSLDYEKNSQFNLTVKVTDGKHIDTALVQVNIININDHNPMFSKTIYEFVGAKETGAVLGKLMASDQNAGSVLRFSLVENSTMFVINELGQVIMTGEPDDITEPEYKLFAVVEDSGIPPRQGSAVVLVTYDVSAPGSGATLGETSGGQGNLIIIIILGVIAGVLVIIIIILCIYIYRKEKGLSCSATCDCCSDLAKSDNAEDKSAVTLTNVLARMGSFRRSRAEMTVSPEPSQSDTPILESNNPKYHESNHIIRSQSFEKGLDLDKNDYKTYMDITDPEGLAYTPAKERHLKMYNDVSLDGDSTTTQENPFSIENGYAHKNGHPHISGSLGYVHQNGSHNSLPHNSSQYSSSVERNNGINEIEYATAITPLDHSSGQGSESTLCADSSVASSTQSVLDMSTFRAGSTQRLVSNPKGSQSSRKGSSVSSVNMKNKGSSVSFIDNHQVNVYNPQNAIDPRMAGPQREERPGITLYY